MGTVVPMNGLKNGFRVFRSPANLWNTPRKAESLVGGASWTFFRFRWDRRGVQSLRVRSTSAYLRQKGRFARPTLGTYFKNIEKDRWKQALSA
jgi:hypothetical protein